MDKKLQEEIVEKIMNTLSSQRFANWYSEGGNFDKWICGDLPRVNEKTIKQDIINLFKLNN